MEKFLKNHKVYQGKVITLDVDEVEIKGHQSIREVVRHNGGACIALQDKDGKYLMVKQYRYAINQEVLEFCAGKLEIGEDPKTAAIRECQEELGYTCVNVKELGYIYPTVGYCDEKIYLYYAEALEKTSQNLDEDEDVEIYKYSLDEIHSMIQNNEINDAKTIALAYKLLTL